MKPAPTCEPPSHVRRVASTSFAILSETGAAFLIDCGDPSVVEVLQEWVREGVISGVEACWITHYHDDHVDALGELRREFGCPIVADAHQAEIIEHPQRFFLPCISPYAAPVARATQDRDTWRWHEFTMTAFHFPGQTYYGGGLLVEGRGTRLFFAGDSGSPTGIDDHCPANRNFLGAGRGFRRCIGLWRELKPDLVFNQHQEQPFSFSMADLDHMDSVLVERERLFSELLPWADPNLGTDENWVRAYPYEQSARVGVAFTIDVQFTNHGAAAVEAQVEPVLRDGWRWVPERSLASIRVPARTCGTIGQLCGNPDVSAHLWVVPEDTQLGRQIIPLRITWGERYLGQFRHAIVSVGE